MRAGLVCFWYTVIDVQIISGAWFIACESKALKEAPLAVIVQGRPLVMFRGAGRAASALTDRCPHRNVPLSMGRVRNGELECAYHGWRFDSAGQCVAVPGLVEGAVSLKSRCAETWATQERDGFVWVYSSPGVTPESSVYALPHVNDARYSTVRRRFEVKAGVHAVVENTLDVPHTAFLHGGLFRTPEKKNVIDVVVRRHPLFAEAQFIGEPRPKGVLGKLLAPRGGIVEHTDRFLLPSIAQVEYRLGDSSHLISTSVLTPVSDVLTVVYAVVTFKLPLPAWLVKPFVMPVAKHIFAQDAVVLARQTEQVTHFGAEKFTSTELDVLGPYVAKLLRQAAAGEVAPEGVHEHRVKMKV